VSFNDICEERQLNAFTANATGLNHRSVITLIGKSHWMKRSKLRVRSLNHGARARLATFAPIGMRASAGSAALQLHESGQNRTGGTQPDVRSDGRRTFAPDFCAN